MGRQIEARHGNGLLPGPAQKGTGDRGTAWQPPRSAREFYNGFPNSKKCTLHRFGDLTDIYETMGVRNEQIRAESRWPDPAPSPGRGYVDALPRSRRCDILCNT